MKRSLFIAPIISLIIMQTPATADVLLLEAITEEAPNSADGIMRPSRGMNMATVKQQYGSPVHEHPWIGEPPITRWDYDGYSVFFENELVLNTVVHR